MAKRKRVIQQRGPLGMLQSTYEEEEEQDDGIVADGERVHVPMWAMDAVQRDVAQHAGKPLVTDGTDNPLALHRPGFRLTANLAERTAADAALTEAYQEVAVRDANAWRTADEDGTHPLLVNKRGTVPAKREGGSCQIDGRRGRLQMVNGELQCIPDKQDAIDAREAAYAAYDLADSEAWRNS
jgi:hypothetical protein